MRATISILLLATLLQGNAQEPPALLRDNPYYTIARIFQTNSPAVGDFLPDLGIHDRSGKPFSPRDLKGRHHVVIFGCLTCPNFLERVEAYEGLRLDYESKGVGFYFVYKSLAHFERNGYVTPFTLTERLRHIREAEQRLDTKIPWLCDNMANEFSTRMGRAPNSEFVLNPEGKVIWKRAWSKPKSLRHFLVELIGPIAKPTIPDNLYYQFKPPPPAAPAGLVKRVEILRHLRPLIVEPVPEKNGSPFYAKLRVDADPELLAAGKGKGQLYLGFFLDRIYGVHWNNLIDPIRVEIDTPAGVTIRPTRLTGPRSKHPSDIDPREFLVDLEATDISQPLKVTVHYHACNDQEGWCLPLTQRYVVQLKLDPAGGKPLGRMLHH
ncbi:MAG: hypothetical protein ACPGVU_08240 [Limisphaerales bacterium]